MLFVLNQAYLFLEANNKRMIDKWYCKKNKIVIDGSDFISLSFIKYLAIKFDMNLSILIIVHLLLLI